MLLHNGEVSSSSEAYAKVCTSLHFEELGIEPISIQGIYRSNKTGEVHTPTVVPTSDLCACGCKKLIYDFKPAIVLHVTLTKRITQQALTKLAAKMIEHTDMLGLEPLHVLHVSYGLQYIIPPVERLCDYFPPINLLTGVYV